MIYESLDNFNKQCMYNVVHFSEKYIKHILFKNTIEVINNNKPHTAVAMV